MRKFLLTVAALLSFGAAAHAAGTVVYNNLKFGPGISALNGAITTNPGAVGGAAMQAGTQLQTGTVTTDTVASTTGTYILNPGATTASLTLTLAKPTATGGQELWLYFINAATALTVTPVSGTTAAGLTAPTAATAGQVMHYHFYNNVWYRLS